LKSSRLDSHCLNKFAQAGFITCTGVFVNSSLGYGSINDFESLGKKLEGNFPVTFGYGLPDPFNISFHQGFVSLINSPPSPAATMLFDS
jgi:hypothetical protein